MRILAALGLLILGAGTGIATVAVHRLSWALVLAVAATTLTAYAVPPAWWGRLAFAAGWVVTVGWLAVPRPEGDYLIGQDWQGYLVLGVGMLLILVGVATLPRPRRAAPLP